MRGESKGRCWYTYNAIIIRPSGLGNKQKKTKNYNKTELIEEQKSIAVVFFAIENFRNIFSETFNQSTETAIDWNKK